MPDPVPPRPAVPTGAGGTPAISEPAAELAIHGLEDIGLTQGQLAWRRFKRHKLALIATVMLMFVGIICALPSLLTRYPNEELDLIRGATGPSLEGGYRAWHPFGTDTLGRDQLSRVLYGGRISLLVGIGVAGFSGVFGTFVGALSGFFGGKLDNFLMRTTDLFISIPLLVVLILMSQILGGSVFEIVLILSLFFWMPIARIVRGVFLSLKEKEFIEAARASGATNRRIIFRHMLSNSLGPIIVNLTLSVAAAILTESTLSFLGFGVRPPTPTWGNMLNDGQLYLESRPYLVWFPGMMILITVLSVNFLGDGMRDALDPTQQRVRA